MVQQMKALKAELNEHNDSENELAKRSHFYQRVISKYKAQIKVLQEDIDTIKIDGGSSIMSGVFNS